MGLTEVVDLWPTKLMQKTLANCSEPNQGLLQLARSWDKNKRNLTTDYYDNNPFELNSPSTNWLRDEVNASVVEYLELIKINYSVDWQIHGWFNINRFGDYHDPHNHPHSYLSGTYYLKMPPNEKAKKQRRDVRPNRITFYDPRTSFNMFSIKKVLLK